MGDIDRMVREAEQYAEEDKAAKERIDAKNSLESYCYQMKNTLSEDKFKSAVSEEDATALSTKVDEVMAWLDTAEHAEKEEFDSMQKDLESIANPIMTKMYQGAPEAACLVACPLARVAVMAPPSRRSANSAPTPRAQRALLSQHPPDIIRQSSRLPFQNKSSPADRMSAVPARVCEGAAGDLCVGEDAWER